MKALALLAAVAAPALLIAAPASAQVTPDEETFAIALNGSVPSVCELIPEGNGSYTVDMLDTGNQGFLVIGYSCNSPYTVSLRSDNGGMKHGQSSIVIDYNVESFGFLNAGGFDSTNSASMTSDHIIATNSDWQNILLNGGIRTGNLELSFDSLAEFAVAGTYSDVLTITLTATL